MSQISPIVGNCLYRNIDNFRKTAILLKEGLREKKPASEPSNELTFRVLAIVFQVFLAAPSIASCFVCTPVSFVGLLSMAVVLITADDLIKLANNPGALKNTLITKHTVHAAQKYFPFCEG